MSEKGNTVTICSVGDLMICDSPLYASVGVGSKFQTLKGKLFSNCREVFESADVVIGNLETVVYEPKNKSLAETQMCCSEDVIRELRQAGFSVINIANNHCMQHGVTGFENTKKACSESGIHPIGVRDEDPYFKEVNGVKIAFLSLCIHLEWYEPEHILYEDRIGRILESVRELRKKDEKLVIVVSVHWGDEYATYPSNAQTALAHRLIEDGATMILGHHSHVYQGIEEYKGGLAIYGQGNFISDMIPEICRQTGIVKIQVDVTDHMHVKFDLLPMFIGSDYIPVASDGDWVEGRQELLEKALNGQFSEDEYWNEIKINRGRGHNAFKHFFKTNIWSYKPAVSFKMILEFMGRKLKRVTGRTTDGKVSSMDEAIFAAIQSH